MSILSTYTPKRSGRRAYQPRSPERIVPLQQGKPKAPVRKNGKPYSLNSRIRHFAPLSLPDGSTVLIRVRQSAHDHARKARASAEAFSTGAQLDPGLVVPMLGQDDEGNALGQVPARFLYRARSLDMTGRAGVCCRSTWAALWFGNRPGKGPSLRRSVDALVSACSGRTRLIYLPSGLPHGDKLGELVAARTECRVVFY